MVSIVTLFIGVTTAMIAAQQTDSISHKYLMVEAINHEDYTSAISHIKHIENWEKDYEIDLNYAIPFLFYADSLKIDSVYIDSITVYIGKQIEEYAIVEQMNENNEVALKYYVILAELYSQFLDKNNIHLAYSLCMLGVILYEMTDYNNAENILLESVRIYSLHSSFSYHEHLLALGCLFEIYENRKEYSKVEKYLLESLDVSAKLYKTYDYVYLSLLERIGSLYLATENYTKAEEYLVDSIENRLESLKANNVDQYDEFMKFHVNNLGYLYRHKEIYDKALYYFIEEVNYYQKSQDTLSLDYVLALQNLGAVYNDMFQYEKADKYCIEALTRFRSISSDTLSSQYANILEVLGQKNVELMNFLQAEQYFLNSIKIIKAIPNHNIDLMKLYIKLGYMYMMVGKYTLAEKYLLDALEICKSYDSMLHSYAETMRYLGLLNVKMGNYELAEEWYYKSLKIQEEFIEISPQSYAETLTELGDLYYYLGDYNKCEQKLLSGLEIFKTNGCDRRDSILMAFVYEELGFCYQKKGENTKADLCMTEAQTILNQKFDTLHIDKARFKFNLGIYYSRQGKDSLALQSYLEYIDLWGYTFEELPLDYMLVLNNIALCYVSLNDYKSAEKYANKLYNICDSILDPSHPEIATYFSNIGWVYNLSKAYDKAQPFFFSAYDIHRDNYLSSLNYLGESQRILYWNMFSGFFNNNCLQFVYRYHFTKPSISTFAYNNELFRKGLQLTSSESVKRSILESNDTTLISQWNTLTTKKQQIQVLQEKEPQSDYLKQIQEEAEQLEKQITRSSAAYRENQAMWQITWDSVQNHLSSNDVAIEYFSAPLSEDSTMYCALLLRHDSQYPELIPLFEEKEVSSFLSTSNGNITNQSYDYYSNGDTISKLVWSKILPKINEGETIYFAPSGLLHQLAIEYLPYDENRTMSDVYNMVRLSSTREIVLNKPQTEYTTATIYGGIAYDLEEDILLAESENYAKENLLASRSIENDTLNRGNVKYLPGTKKEAESINTLLKQNNISAKLYTIAQANEESFKALSGKHSNILHIGTHGFTWTDSVAKKQDYFTQRMQLQTLDGSNRFITPTIDPLNRCGLLFAGANIALQGNSKNLPEGVQDGILTAKEISLMDLRDANLVVLSACETAKGDITSEGVFGLQRAFKMAGVQTIIMSLWKVNDQATQLLMTEFYNNWIGKHQSKREAFRNAQNTVRTQYEEPEYWAGFIMLD